MSRQVKARRPLPQKIGLPPLHPLHPKHLRIKTKHVARVGIASEATYHVSELMGLHLGTVIATSGLLLVLIIHVFLPEGPE